MSFISYFFKDSVCLEYEYINYLLLEKILILDTYKKCCLELFKDIFSKKHSENINYLVFIVDDLSSYYQSPLYRQHILLLKFYFRYEYIFFYSFFDIIIFVFFNIFLYVYYNAYIALFILIFFSFFLTLNNNNLYNIKSKKNFFYFKNNKSFFFFYILNFFILFYFLIIYFLNLYYNNYENYFILFCKKLKIVNIDLNFVIHLDYISFYFIFLTVFIFFLIYFTFFNLRNKKDINNINVFIFLFFIIEVLLILTFTASNLFFFFIFFETSLIPLYLLVLFLGKGKKKKHFASLALIFYTLFGSIFLLIGILYLNKICNSLDFRTLSLENIDFNSQVFLFSLFFLGFSVKVPIFPFYSWLPEAHVEASTSLSILLASIFLKVATYAFLKIVILNFFIINVFFHTFVFFFCIISILLASFLSLISIDLKKIIALSSIIHMNYIVLSLFSLKSKAIFGALIYMFSHAFVSSGLFFLIGILYENNNTRNLINFNNSLKHNSKFFFFFLIFNLANVSFPLTMAFIAEIIILNNLTFISFLLLVIVLFSMLFSTLYTFWMLHNVSFGKLFFKKNYFFLTKFDLFFLFFLLVIIISLGLFVFCVMFNIEQEIYILIQKKINVL